MGNYLRVNINLSKTAVISYKKRYDRQEKRPTGKGSGGVDGGMTRFVL